MYRGLFFLVLCILYSTAMIRVFDGSDSYSKLVPKTASNNYDNSKLHYWSAMFSVNDTPAGTMDAFINVDLSFYREETASDGFLDVLIFPRSLYNFIGYYPSKDAAVEYCCTAANIEKTGCDGLSVGHVIYRDDKELHIKSIEFDAKNNTASYQITFPVVRSEIYNVLMVNCEGNNVGAVTFSGTITWKNPFGYLPGDLYGRLPFSGVMALLYIGLFLFYFVLCVKYRKILMTLQWGILGVLGFVLIETASWYFYRLGINNSGLYSNTGLLFVVLFSNIKHTVVRVVVLLVSMGLGVVKWTLGPARIKIGVLSAFYMFFSFLFQMVKEVSAVAEKDLVNSWVTFFVVVPKAILDTGFVYWIFLSLIRTMQQLTLRHQVLKLDMYKRFFVVLVAAGLLTGVSLLYQLYLSVSNSFFPWKYEWMNDSYFDLLFFGVLIGLAILWRPRSNNTRYGYGEFFQVDTENNDDDEENIHQIPMDPVVVGTGELTRRKRSSSTLPTVQQQQQPLSSSTKNNYESDRESTIEKTKLKLTEFDKDIMSIELSEDGEDGEMGIEAQLRKMD